MGVLLNTVVW